MEIEIRKIFGVKRGSNDKSPWITGALCLHDDRVILADSNNPRILLYDGEGSLLNEISLLGNPRDVVLLENSQLVMTLPNELMIQFLDLETFKVTKTVHVGYECFGITLVGKKLVVACGTHLTTLDVNGEILNTTPIRDCSARYICGDDNENLYFTGWNTDAIHCISTYGTYSIMPGNALLKFCRGLVVLNESLFVVGRWSNNIVRFSLNGDHKEPILTKADGLDVPVALTLSRNNTNKFLVTNNNGRSVVICEMVDPASKGQTQVTENESKCPKEEIEQELVNSD